MRQPARYSAVQIVLHWAVVVLIVVQILTGDLMSEYFSAVMRAGGDRPRMGNAVWHMVSGTLILVFGIAGFFVGVLGPVAWIMGSRALREIRSSGAHPGNEQLIVIGRILGIIVTVLMVLGVLVSLLFLVLALVVSASA